MSGAGKGSAPRPVDPTIYGNNYNDIFRKESPQPQPQPQPTEHESEHKENP